MRVTGEMQSCCIFFISKLNRCQKLSSQKAPSCLNLEDQDPKKCCSVSADPVLGRKHLYTYQYRHQYFLSWYSWGQNLIFLHFPENTVRLNHVRVSPFFPFYAFTSSAVVHIKVFLPFRQYLYSMSVRSVLLESCEEYGIPLPGQPPNQKQAQQILNILK
jgi:hypothetical protein